MWWRERVKKKKKEPRIQIPVTELCHLSLTLYLSDFCSHLRRRDPSCFLFLSLSLYPWTLSSNPAGRYFLHLLVPFFAIPSDFCFSVLVFPAISFLFFFSPSLATSVYRIMTQVCVRENSEVDWLVFVFVVVHRIGLLWSSRVLDWFRVDCLVVSDLDLTVLIECDFKWTLTHDQSSRLAYY